jgi:regulation of enolase protein 1 (concanavalin A-like superfamily)/mono/diheme cytochrome c family protein
MHRSLSHVVVLSILSAAAAADFVQPTTLAAGTMVSSFNTVGGRNARLAFHRGYLYVEPQNSGFVASMWDVTNPAAPFRVRDLGVINGSHDLGKTGNSLLFIGGQAIDAGANPNNPTIYSLYGTYEESNFYYPLGFESSSGYATNQANTHRIFDLRNNATIATVNTNAQTGIRACYPIVIGNILYYTTNHDNDGLAAYDISNPAAPVLLDTLPNVGSYGLTMNGKYLVLCHSSAASAAGVTPGVRFVDISNPSNLTQVAFMNDATVPGDHRYPQSQDEYVFVGSAKIDTRNFTVVQTFNGTGSNNFDDNDFLMPMGNMVAIGSRTHSPVRIFVHQQAADTRGPFVNFHNPSDGAINQARTSRIGLVIPENLETSTIINGDTASVTPTSGGAAIGGIWTFNSQSILTFTPTTQLAANTTYEVKLRAGGIKDVAGNAMASNFAFRFSTGATVDGGPVVPPDTTRTTFGNGGANWSINNGTRIPAENFDQAASGVSWSDSTPGSASGYAFRTDTSVDFEATTDTQDDGAAASQANINLGYIAAGEWWEYTTNVTAGRYDIDLRVASGSTTDPGDIRITLGGTVLGTFATAPTGGYQTWTTLTLPSVDLVGGNNRILRLDALGGGINLNWIGFRRTSGTPFGTVGGAPHALQAGLRLPLEDFDVGGQGVAYNDTTTGNAANGTYRPGESVDVFPLAGAGPDTDPRQQGIGYTADGEWLAYTVTSTAGQVRFAARVASGGTNPGSIRLRLNGTVLTTIDVPNTGDWGTWATVVSPQVTLPAVTRGELRVEVVGDAFNMDWLDVRGANAAPVLTSITASAFPALINQSITLTAAATDANGDALQYRWDYGDGSPETAWATANTTTRTYPNPGHYKVVAQVRDPAGAVAALAKVVTVLPRTPKTAPSQASSKITGAPSLNRVWSVNADSSTLAAISSNGTPTKQWEVAVGAGPVSVALEGTTRLWISCRDADKVEVRDAANGALVRTVTLAHGAAPEGLIVDATGGNAYVALSGHGTVLRIRLSDGVVTATLALGPQPRALALSPERNRLLVTRFISPATTGTVWDVRPSDMRLRRTVTIQRDTAPDEGSNGRGTPNYLAGIAISPIAETASIASKKDNTQRGVFLEGQDFVHDQTVRTIVSDITFGQSTDNLARRSDIDNREQASAVAFSPNGDYLFVALQGSNEVIVINAFSRRIEARYDTGRAPQGLFVDAVQKRLFVHDFLGRSISVMDISKLIADGDGVFYPVATVPVVATEPLTAQVLAGKKIFYNAADERMSLEGYISCATCHIDGSQDGRVWDFTGRGEGLRNTTDLRGRRGTGHGRVHWSGNFDEIQDFEIDIRGPFGGTGFMTDAQFSASSAPLGAAKAGRSADLDALAAYVTSLATVGRSPWRTTTGALTADAVAGKAVFESLNCASCHSGTDFTDSAADVLHDVGTLAIGSGKRLGQTLPGIDTPTLRGLWSTAPYFHDGSATSLEQVLTRSGVKHGNMAALSATQATQLVAYLRQIDDTEPAPAPKGLALRGQDIGTVGAAGSTALADGTWTLRGAGADIWGAADGFQFASRPFSGNFTVTARVASLTNTNAWAKAGVMIRAGLAADAINAFAGVTPTTVNGAFVQHRPATGALSVHGQGPAITAPAWVRLTRTGTTVVGSVSTNGTTWTQVASITLALPDVVQVGLATSSHVAGTLNTAVFTDLTITTTPGIAN